MLEIDREFGLSGKPVHICASQAIPCTEPHVNERPRVKAMFDSDGKPPSALEIIIAEELDIFVKETK
jgi:hypothetical protein